MADLIASTGLPAVELRSTHFAGSRPFVGMDNSLVGRMAAEHLINCGYRQFAAYNLHAELFFEERIRNFVAVVHAAGCPCSELSEKSSDTTTDWENTQARLMEWIRSLPKPVGIFAANDQLAVRLLDACQRLDLGVPEEVAVVGAENEETLCAFATPPLTSIRMDGMTVGFLAAEMLDQLMRGKNPAQPETLVSPKGIIERESSDAFVINDRLVAHAARLIRENATAGINVDDLCRRLNASRSTLDRRMKAALNRSPKEEILRVRFREVERLLRETDLTIDAIALQTGFAHSQYLQAAFKESCGMTPGQFRRKYLPQA
jgi:LacI family transcriptional regulator